ncbi:uncharacterized protein LOC108963780 isoform X1 [Serinus canaria]|uniref:uncharacterized protein LOC108963780 isoform X1 n=1 Tax=Serinus canaria TaxID=9135 RepID=UPI0021CCCC4F|nr:uncharacterized protein LOC108963780 isoform X1 [Serinus canaria]
MEPRELLEALVDVVATLGELAATIAGPDRDVRLGMFPGSLHKALDPFISDLQDTLGHHGHTSLGQALAAFRANLGATWAHVTAAASAWQGSVAKLEDSWAQLAKKATELHNACRDTATREATTAATANTRARDLQGTATRWEPSLHNLVAEVWQLPLALDKKEAASLVAVHAARMAAANNEVEAATKAKEEDIVATSEAGAATRRGQKAEAALGLLQRLVATCDTAMVYTWELQCQLRHIEATLKGTNQASPDVPEALVAAVANAELLWEASARLATRHLVGTLEDTRLLVSSHPGDTGGPSGHAVAEQCQKAIEDIPMLLWGQ